MKHERFRENIPDLPQHMLQIYAVTEFPFTNTHTHTQMKNVSPIESETFTAR